MVIMLFHVKQSVHPVFGFREIGLNLLQVAEDLCALCLAGFVPIVATSFGAICAAIFSKPGACLMAISTTELMELSMAVTVTTAIRSAGVSGWFLLEVLSGGFASLSTGGKACHECCANGATGAAAMVLSGVRMSVVMWSSVIIHKVILLVFSRLTCFSSGRSGRCNDVRQFICRFRLLGREWCAGLMALQQIARGTVDPVQVQFGSNLALAVGHAFDAEDDLLLRSGNQIRNVDTDTVT